ncbi:Nif11-like leader peptide family natural product precursor [Nostoc punctiforme UO1]|uniref:Nif11-like leader peptide family natural product precursor n=1 Tax=Nostoc punctiforme TaxID=272131 RepID=UPI003095CE96
MSLKDVQSFYIRIANDESFRIQIKNVQSKEECSQIVKAAGYDFNQEELEEYTNQLLELSSTDNELRDLNEKELEAVFGGISSFFTNPEDRMYTMYGVPRGLWDL